MAADINMLSVKCATRYGTSGDSRKTIGLKRIGWGAKGGRLRRHAARFASSLNKTKYLQDKRRFLKAFGNNTWLAYASGKN